MPAVIPPLITTLGSGIHRTARATREPYRTTTCLRQDPIAPCADAASRPSRNALVRAATAQLAVAGMTPQATRAPPPPSGAGMSE